MTTELRRLQKLALLLTCLPRDGACRELFDMALDVDHRIALKRLRPPVDGDSPRGVHRWLEGIWSDDLTQMEQDVVWWMNSADRLQIAIGELRAVDERTDGKWPAGCAGQG